MKRLFKADLSIRAATILMLAALLFCPNQRASAQQKQAAKLKIKIYLLDKRRNDAPAELVAVERQIPQTRRTSDAALRALFARPTAQDARNNLTSAHFSIIDFNSDCDKRTIKPLLAYYRGVTIKKGVAIVNFTEKGLCYLNSTMAMQHRVKSPIEATLKKFKNVKSVEYAIDEKIFDEWDA